MTAKEKQILAKIVYEFKFIESRTDINMIADTAIDLFDTIKENFDIKEELKKCVYNDVTLFSAYL